MKEKIVIFVAGPKGLEKGKLTEIISTALSQHYLLDNNLGENAQRDTDALPDRVMGPADVMELNAYDIVIEHLHTDSIKDMDEQADHLTGVVTGYTAYPHSSGMKVIPIIKTAG